jgi:hypothetical protein
MITTKARRRHSITYIIILLLNKVLIISIISFFLNSSHLRALSYFIRLQYGYKNAIALLTLLSYQALLSPRSVRS